MSYCRWSSDHFECDVYVYEGHRWVTHVAGRRRKNKLPDAIKAMYPRFDSENFVSEYMAAKSAENEWIKSQPHKTVMAKSTDGTAVAMYFLADSEFQALPAPHAGRTYEHDSPGECADWLLVLREAGFNVPQHAVDALREEQAEMNAEGEGSL